MCITGINLLQKNYETTKDVNKTIVKTVSEIKGHYAFVAMFEGLSPLAADPNPVPIAAPIGPPKAKPTVPPITGRIFFNILFLLI